MRQGRGTTGGIQRETMKGRGGAAGGGIGGQAGGCQAVGVDGSLGGADSDGTALQHLQGHHRQEGHWLDGQRRTDLYRQSPVQHSKRYMEEPSQLEQLQHQQARPRHAPNLQGLPGTSQYPRKQSSCCLRRASAASQNHRAFMTLNANVS